MVTPVTNRRAGEHDTCDRAGEHDTCDGDGMKAKALFCEASITCANNTCMNTCLPDIMVSKHSTIPVSYWLLLVHLVSYLFSLLAAVC